MYIFSSFGKRKRKANRGDTWCKSAASANRSFIRIVGNAGLAGMTILTIPATWRSHCGHSSKRLCYAWMRSAFWTRKDFSPKVIIKHLSLFQLTRINRTSFQRRANIIGYNFQFWRSFFFFFFRNCYVCQLGINREINVAFITVGWASWQNVQGFGEPPTAKSQMLNLIKSIRTVMRGKYRERLTRCYCCTTFLHNALIFSSSDILQYLDINCEARARLIGKRCRNVYEWNALCASGSVENVYTGEC